MEHDNQQSTENRRHANTAVAQLHTGENGAAVMQDNRPQAVVQRKLQSAMGSGVLLQRKANSTGLPDNLKSGIENLSGHSMDDVKVHYNSSAPAQLNAHAYAQGNQIHVAPGQEKHVPHEAWHVVQQKEGRVKPTMQMKGKVNVNDDSGLEREADVMGAKALQQPVQRKHKIQMPSVKSNTVQLAATVAHAGGANPLVNQRHLGIRRIERHVIRFGQGNVIRERIYIQGNPHFSRNMGRIAVNGNVLTRTSVPGVAHSEPILIGRSYGAAPVNPTWMQANAAVDATNLAAGGAANRHHMTLFTERVPCVNCGHELAQARYVAQDNVTWNYNDTAGVTGSHLNRAQLQYPNYLFAVGGGANDWLLVGWRLLPLPERMQKQQPPKKDEEKKDDGASKKRSGSDLYSAFDKRPRGGLAESGSKGNPIAVG